MPKEILGCMKKQGFQIAGDVVFELLFAVAVESLFRSLSCSMGFWCTLASLKPGVKAAKSAGSKRRIKASLRRYHCSQRHSGISLATYMCQFCEDVGWRAGTITSTGSPKIANSSEQSLGEYWAIGFRKSACENLITQSSVVRSK